MQFLFTLTETIVSIERSKMETKVAGAGVITEKHGHPVYENNPSVPQEGEIKKVKKQQLGNEQQGMLINESSGEIMGKGSAVHYEWEEVDKERFVKLFLEGLRQASGLTKPGMAVFEIVYNELRDTPGKDTVRLSYLTSGLNKATFYRGMRNLLDNGFLYRSPFDGTFFVNIRYMFNGDRLAFVKAYTVKGTNAQRELPLETPALED